VFLPYIVFVVLVSLAAGLVVLAVLQLQVTRAPSVKTRFKGHLRTLAQPSALAAGLGMPRSTRPLIDAACD
jgi:hypothetical protein